VLPLTVSAPAELAKKPSNDDTTRFFDRFTANLPFRVTQHDVGMLVKQQDAPAGSGCQGHHLRGAANREGYANGDFTLDKY
jgi:hypothetical protein